MTSNLVFLSLAMAFNMGVQAEIIHTNGSFEIPLMGMSRSLDMNNDGVTDFVFRSETPLVTFDVPSSGSASSFHLDASRTNQFLVSDYALVQPLGVSISSNAPVDAKWCALGSSALLTTHWLRQNAETVSEGWNGSLGELKEGCLGVRFYAADGLHFGWIHVRLPKSDSEHPPLTVSPIIVDWAYEAKTNVPIQTGRARK